MRQPADNVSPPVARAAVQWRPEVAFDHHSHRTALPQSARLVLFHGLASSSKEFGLLFHPLRRGKIGLLTPEVPGYSQSMLDASAGWPRWVEAAVEGVHEALGGDVQRPFVLGGLCTGAMLAIAVAASKPWPGLRGLALLSPLFAYDGWSLPWWYSFRRLAYALHVARYFSMRERAPYGLKDERMRARVRQQLDSQGNSMVGPSSVPLHIVRESERLSRHARALLPAISLPITALHAREDEICSLSSVQAALAGLQPQRCTLGILENSYHMITADNDRQQVAEALIEFVRQVTRPQAALACVPASGRPKTMRDTDTAAP